MAKKSKDQEAVDIFLFVIVAGAGAAILFVLIKYLFSDVRLGRRRILRVHPAFDGVFPNDIAHDLARIRPQLFHNNSGSTILSSASL